MILIMTFKMQIFRAIEKEKRDQERRGKYLRKQMEREKSLSAVREK